MQRVVITATTTQCLTRPRPHAPTACPRRHRQQADGPLPHGGRGRLRTPVPSPEDLPRIFPPCAPASWPAPSARSRVMKRCVNDMHMSEVAIAYGMTETSLVSCQTRADDLDRRTATIARSTPTWRSRSLIPLPARRWSAARQASSALVATPSCSATGRTRRRPQRPSTATDGCKPATWPRCARTATATSSADQGHGHPRRRECLPKEIE